MTPRIAALAALLAASMLAGCPPGAGELPSSQRPSPAFTAEEELEVGLELELPALPPTPRPAAERLPFRLERVDPERLELERVDPPEEDS